ncbi:MAG TPA: glycosyltransferase [Burkholderiaceae bacterium]|nr:glycosyltransferase [Burkholderiaceae bacterium]
MNIPAQITASVVSHGQARLVNALIADLALHASAHLKRLVVTMNVPEAEAVRCDGVPFEVLLLRNNRPLGFGANQNRAFQHCDTAWFAVLNPDLRFSDDALGRMLAEREPHDGLIAPLILNADGSPADAARRLPTPFQIVSRKLRWKLHGPDPDFDWLAGMCLLLDSEVFRSLGGFDERYFMYCEDADLCLRMQLAGWHLHHVPSVKLVHEARRDSHRSPRYMGWHIASLIRLWMSPTFWSYLQRRNDLGQLRPNSAGKGSRVPEARNQPLIPDPDANAGG